MSRFPSAVGLFLLTLGLGACGPGASAHSDPAADLAAIGVVRSSFVSDAVSGDAAAMAGLYTADAVLMAENQPPVTGHDAILAYYQGMLGQNTVKTTLTADETVVAGDWAYDRGQFTLAMTPRMAGGTPLSEQGKYLVVLQRQADKSWKLAREIGNSNVPMMPELPSPTPPPSQTRPAAPATPAATPAKPK